MSEIESAIDNSAAFILFVSPAYALSEVCRQEANRAAEDGKRIIPVLIEETRDLGELDWIKGLNWIDATATENAQSASNAIVTAAQQNPDWQRTHKQLLTQARNWENSGQSRSRLLRGDDISMAEVALAATRLPGDPQPVDLQHRLLDASRAHRRRRRQGVAAVAALVTASSLALAAIALVQRNSAESARQEAEAALAESRRLQAEAEARVLSNVSESEPDPVWSALYAIEALYRTSNPLPEAQEAWLAAVRRYTDLSLTPSKILTLDEGETLSSIAPNGQRFLIESSGTGGRITDQTGRTLSELSDFDGRDAWTSDGSMVAFASDGPVIVVGIDGDMRALPGSVGHDPLSWSPDKSLLLTLFSDGNYNEIGFFQIDPSGDDEYMGSIGTGYMTPTIRWSSDSRYVALASTDILGDSPTAFVEVLDFATGESGGQYYGRGEATQTIVLHEGQGSPSLLVAHEDGTLFEIPEASLTSSEPAGTESPSWSVPGTQITAIEASADGTQLAVAASDGTLIVNSATVSLPDDGGPAGMLRWSPDGNRLAVATETGALAVFDGDGLTLGEVEGRTPAEAPRALEWNGDGTEVLVGWPSGDITRYQLLGQAGPVSTAATTGLKQAAWSPDNSVLAIGDPDGTVQFLSSDGQPSEVRYSTTDAQILGDTTVWDMEWSPDGSHLAVEYLNGGLAVLNATQTEVAGFQSIRWTGPMGISWSPDSQFVATVGEDFSPLFLSVNGETRTTAGNDPVINGESSRVVFLSNGALAVQTFDDQIFTLDSDGSRLNELVLSDSDQLWGGDVNPVILSSADGIQVLNLDGTPSEPISTKEPYGRWPTWSPDGELLAFIADDLTVSLASVEGTFLQSIDIPARRPATSIAWSGTSSFITEHEDGSVYWVDISTAEPTLVNLGLDRVARAFPSSDGSRLATIAPNGQLTIRRALQPGELCRELLALADIDQFSLQLSRVTPEQFCTTDFELGALTLPPIAAIESEPTGETEEVTTGQENSAEQDLDPNDLSIIDAATTPPTLITGPVKAADRWFAFSVPLESFDASILTAWELTDTGWEINSSALDDVVYAPLAQELIEIDVDGVNPSELFMRFSANGPVGVVLRFEGGVWSVINGGENLEYRPGEGLFGVGNDCDPSCAEGNAIPYTLIWDGDDLVAERLD